MLLMLPSRVPAADAPCGIEVPRNAQHTASKKRGRKKAITPPLRGEKWCTELRSVLPRGPSAPQHFQSPVISKEHWAAP